MPSGLFFRPDYGEIFQLAGSRGLGPLIWLSWEVLRIQVLYAVLFLTAALGVSFNLLMQFLLGRLVPWAPRTESV